MKHCIFDLGNVLFRFDMEHILSHRFDPKTAEALAPAFFDRRIWDRMDDGTITDEEAKDAICASQIERVSFKERRGSAAPVTRMA